MAHPSIEKARALLDRLKEMELTRQRVDTDDDMPVRRATSEVIYKRYETPARHKVKSMDDAGSKQWNAWADDRIRNSLEPAMDAAADVVGKAFRSLKSEMAGLREEIAKTRADVDGLRSDLEQMRGAKTNMRLVGR